VKILFITTRPMNKIGKADQITLFHAADYLTKNGNVVDEFVVQKSNAFTLLLNIWRVLFKKLPLQSVLYRNGSNKRKLKQLICEKNYDRVYFHLIRTSEYVTCSERDKSYLGMQLSQSLNFSRTASYLPFSVRRLVYSIEAFLCRGYEKQIIERFKFVNFVGTSDPEFLGIAENSNVKIIPHGVDIPISLADTTSGDLVFLANFSSDPNKIALNHLVYNLFPKLQKLYPKISLTIAGRNIPKPILDLNIMGLDVVGPVSDANFLISQHKIFCNPVKASAGMQNKVVCALMSSVPVVTYKTAVEGMQLQSELLKISELNDDAFIKLVGKVYENYPTELEREAASTAVRERWNWDALHEKWCTDFLELQHD
jgi:hypothetical protein